MSGYEACQVFVLAPIDADDGGLERRFLAPFDVIERVERRSEPIRVPQRLWRRACRALIAGDTPPGALKSARLARIELLPYQLEPALALVRGLGSRVLLADEVGLGKTIQAGLMISELRARGAAGHVLIITPAGLRDQWAQELSERFNIDAAVLDMAAVRRLAATLPLGVNPWETVSIAIASIDYFKRPEVLAAAAARPWDVVVVDEAHGVAGNSDRHAAVSAIARQAAYVVLLTATPHSGDRRAFASLCDLGATAGDRLLAFRRSRQNLPHATARRIHRLEVRLSRDESRMHALLARFSTAVRREHNRSHVSDDLWLALSVLHKRALSSARSLQQSVARRLAAMTSPQEHGANQLQLPLTDHAGELVPDDEAPAWSPLLGLQDAARERELLGDLADAAAQAARNETKIAALGRLLRRINEPAIVFTEFRDTLQHIQASLRRPAVMLHGGLTREERRAAIRRFTSGDTRLLLATDAAGEGLNLQGTCRFVINLELPWNPMRLEQRIGRVDRIGQSKHVHVVHLIARDSGESQVLSRLKARVARMRSDVGGADPLGQGGDYEDADEAAMARLVIAGQMPATVGQNPRGAARPAEPFWTPSLEHDAHTEARRVAATRLLTRKGDERVRACLESRGPCVMRARHARTRAHLHGRSIMLWQVVAADVSGREVDSSIVAIAVSGQVEQEELLRFVNRAADPWRERVTNAHQGFISTRLGREQGMEANRRLLRAARSSRGFQPGLFDRRGERARLFDIAADRDGAERSNVFERALTISFLPPRLLFVLAP